MSTQDAETGMWCRFTVEIEPVSVEAPREFRRGEKGSRPGYLLEPVCRPDLARDRLSRIPAAPGNQAAQVDAHAGTSGDQQSSAAAIRRAASSYDSTLKGSLVKVCEIYLINQK